jgi:excisionase family DNA binding protein
MTKERDRLIALDEASEWTGLKVGTLRLWCKLGRIEWVKLGSRALIFESEVERLIAENRKPRRAQDGATTVA